MGEQDGAQLPPLPTGWRRKLRDFFYRSREEFPSNLKAVVAVGSLVVVGIFVWIALSAFGNSHDAVMVFIPLAAALSFLIVMVLETVDGQIKIKFPGFGFEGASGPIIMWVLCFLAIILAVSTLWPLH